MLKIDELNRRITDQDDQIRYWENRYRELRRMTDRVIGQIERERKKRRECEATMRGMAVVVIFLGLIIFLCAAALYGVVYLK